MKAMAQRIAEVVKAVRSSTGNPFPPITLYCGVGCTFVGECVWFSDDTIAVWRQNVNRNGWGEVVEISIASVIAFSCGKGVKLDDLAIVHRDSIEKELGDDE